MITKSTPHKSTARTANTVETYRAYLVESAAANARLSARAFRALPFILAGAVALYAATLSSPDDLRAYAGAVAGALVGICGGVALAARSVARDNARKAAEVSAMQAAHRAALSRNA